MLALGGIISLGSFAAAADGGSYVVAIGLLVVGGLNVVRGIYYQIRYEAARRGTSRS